MALAGLIQSGLLKRFESSLHAALATVTNMLRIQDAVIVACEQTGTVPSPASMRELYTEAREGEVPPETVEEILYGDEDGIPLEVLTPNYLDDLRKDRALLATMKADLETMAAQPDPKLAALKQILVATPAQKVAVFTTYADTARYLRGCLESELSARGGRRMTSVIGDELDSDQRQHQIERFCPKSVTGDETATAPDGEVDLLVATDVISEGQNLQQAQAVISYDMPWNPQRVVQRNGRVIRLLSPHAEVYLYTLLLTEDQLQPVLGLEARLVAKIRAANASVGMESPVLADLESEERTFADLQEFVGRLAAGDAVLLDEGEGAASGMFAGEEYRQLLARAVREGRRVQLSGMPWGVGAAFAAHPDTPDVALPAVVFGAQDRRGKRYWRAVTGDGAIVDVDLHMLRLADPREEPRAAPLAAVDLEGAWRVAAEHICAAHNAFLDPAVRAVQLPASQRWASDLFLDPSLPQRGDFEQAYAALQVPRDQVVLRALSAIRREVHEGRRKPLDAAEEIANLVLNVFGLQPVAAEPYQPYMITPEDLGVVAYQVVLPA